MKHQRAYFNLPNRGGVDVAAGFYRIQSFAVNNNWNADNLYYDNTFGADLAGWRYVDNGRGSVVYHITGGASGHGAVAIYTAANNTAGAGAAATITQRMLVAHDGVTVTGAISATASTTTPTLYTGFYRIQSFAVNNNWNADNLYYDGTGWRYVGNGRGSVVYHTTGGASAEGAVGIYTAPNNAGGADAAATITQRMLVAHDGTTVTGTLSTTGNVTIGDNSNATQTLTANLSAGDVTVTFSNAGVQFGAVTLNVTGTRFVQSYHTDITSTNAVTVDSSRTVKRDIESYAGDALALVEGMDVVTYRHKEQLDPSGDVKLGIIAESVHEPLAVRMIGDESESHLGLNLMSLLTLNTRAIQQLIEVGRELREENRELRARLQRLETE